MSLTVAVLTPGECVLTVIHRNVDISTSGVGELFLAIHGCTIASGCVGSEGECVGNVGGYVGAAGVSWRHRR
jgi:hypothetical protein